MNKLAAKVLWSIVYLVIGFLIFILGLNLLKWIPRNFQDIYKIGLPILLLIAWLASRMYFPAQKTVFLAFFLVSVGWVIDFYLSGILKDWFSLNTTELTGMAFTMVISMTLVTIPVLIGWLVSGHKLVEIFVQGPTRMWGIWVGLLGLLLFGGLGVLQSLGQGLATESLGFAILFALVFSLANGFREELVYRAALLNGFKANIGVWATIIVTTLVFAVAHVDVSYFPPSQIIFAVVLLIIGVVGSLIMIKTRSLIGAVLFHAGADVLLIMGLLASGQLLMQ